MTTPTLFFATICPDTQPFITQLNKLNIAYNEVEIMSSMTNLKHFLALRDEHTAFTKAKQHGYVGIPALLLTNGRIILSLDELTQDLIENK